VRDVDDNTPIAGATVSTDWTDYTVSALGRSAGHQRHAETKANAPAFFCSAECR